MEKYPQSVKIGGITYNIKMTDCMRLGIDNVNAEIDYQACEIRVSSIPNQDKQNVALLHEITHALFIQQGEIDHDEKLIERISQSLYGFIKDNPGLILALLGKQKRHI